MDINIQDKHYNKYIKYKTKYLELKEQSGRGLFGNPEVYEKIQSDQNGGMVYIPAYCKKWFLGFIPAPARYKMCNIYHGSYGLGERETYIKNNLINEYIEDLKKKRVSYDENKLKELNKIINDKVSEVFNLYNIPDYTIEKSEQKLANQNKILAIKNDVLNEIDNNLGNMDFKEHLKEIISTYFTWAYLQAVDIRSKQYMISDESGSYTPGAIYAASERHNKERRLGYSLNPQYEIDKAIRAKKKEEHEKKVRETVYFDPKEMYGKRVP
jgi:hypothetical protein